jgi:hypothetical protein
MKLLLSFITALFIGTCISQDFTEVIKMTAFDRGEEDRLGYSVAMDGNYAVVGAYGKDNDPLDPNTGAAYIYEKTGIDNWTFVQQITNSDQFDYDRFGYAVAIDGDFIVVGAYNEDEDAEGDNTVSKAGSAYIFQRGIDGVWTEMQKIVASDREEDDEFGWSVDIDDSTLIVGAHFEGHDVDGGSYIYHAGSAYIFDLDESGVWNETQKIVASHRSADRYYPHGRPDEEDLSDLFGGTVAISGDYIIVGAHNHDFGPSGPMTGTRWNAGAAYVFERSDGTWTEVQKLMNHDRFAWDRFGYAVDIDSSTIVVGVWSEDESEFGGASLKNAGSAYIFTRDIDGVWNEVQKLDASDRTTGDHFGIDVQIDGDYLICGAEQEDLDTDGGDNLSNAGAAYIFFRDEHGVWEEINKIVPSDRQIEDRFGEGVAISGHTVLVGAWQQDYTSPSADYLEDAGAAYFFSSITCEAEFIDQAFTICRNDSIVVGQNSYTETGIYIDTLLNTDACDSIITTNLTVIEPILIEQDITICSGISYTINGNDYTETGVYIDTMVAASSCDSIVTTNLTVTAPITYSQDITICAGTSYAVGDSVYVTSGTKTNLLSTPEGCDSIVTTNLTVTPPITYLQDITICSGTTFTVGDSVYTTAGVKTNLLSTPGGCDSIVTTYLSIDPPINHLMDLTICAGNSVEIGESVYTETGTYMDYFVTASGCDSTVTLHLTVNPPLTHTQDIAICYNEVFAVGDSIYEESGTYINELVTPTGCDSIVTTNLTVYPENVFSQEVTICSGNTLVVGVNEYAESGIYVDTVSSILTGCDSIINTTLTVNDPLTYSQDVTLCFGDSIAVGDLFHSIAGTYTDELTTPTGCDSIVTTHLTIRDENTYEQSISLCGGEIYAIGDAEYDVSGIYMDTLISLVTGCDSIVTTHLDIMEPIDVTINQPDVLTLISNEPEGPTTNFQWYRCFPLQLIEGATAQTFVASDNGAYAVVIEKDFCTDTTECFFINSVGIQESQRTLNGIKCYPNPTNGLFTLAQLSEKPNNLDVVILNSLGAQIFQLQLTEMTTTIDISEFADGVYFVQVTDGEELWVEKLILR